MGLIALVALVAILGSLGLSLYFLTTYRSLKGLRNGTQKAWASIDILLKQRNDELPKLVGVCRSYIPHEHQALKRITEARTFFLKAGTVAEKAQADKLATGALDGLFAVAEQYPDLKADATFRELRGRLTALEEGIAAQHTAFNERVSTYNHAIAGIPANLVASLGHLQPEDLFRAPESDPRDPQIESR